MKRAYRFFNFVADKHGEVFGLCDKHAKTAPTPKTCVREKIGDKTNLHCDFCLQEEDSRIAAQIAKDAEKLRKE